MTLADAGFLDLAPLRLEYRMIGPRPDAAPTIVMLHEGLGSVGLWGSFPDDIASATGAGVFVYSRAGYGKSSAGELPRSTSFLNEEACEVLPRVLDAIGYRRGLLLGHSDGASIATIYAGSVQDHRVRGLVLIAPHFFVEDISVRSIAAVKDAYQTSDLRARLAKYHRDVDAAFWGWNRAWLDPDFRHWRIDEYLAYIRVPILIVQGEDDEYGTPAQIAVAQQEAYCPVEVRMLPGAGHSPQLDRPQETLEAIGEFVTRLARHEGLAPAA